MDYSIRKMADIAPLIRRPVDVSETGLYRQIGIRSFGKGIFHKPEANGLEIGAKKIFAIQPDDLLFNIVFAWEGAVAVASEAEAETVGSHRFLTCQVNPDIASPRYLFWYFHQGKGREQLLRASPGGAGRNRTLNIAKLENIAVPLPSVDEQRRVVARLDRVERLVKAIHAEKTRIAAETNALVSSLHFAFSPAADDKMGGFLELYEDRIPTDAGTAYPQVGVRGFAGGLFKKDAVTGAETSYKHFNRLSEGLLLVSQPKGWEGAVAVCGAEYEGWFASPEYRTFRCIPGKLHPDYLSALLPTPWFQAALAKLTRGQGARRERLRPEMLLAMPIRMPSWEKQLEAIRILERTKAIGASEAAFTANVDALLPAMLHEIFGNGEA